MADIKSIKLNAGQKVVIIVTLLWLMNCICVGWYRYPFLYCLMEPYTTPIYFLWGKFVLYGCCLFICFSVFRFRPLNILYGCLVFAAVIELPNLADHALRLGGSCG